MEKTSEVEQALKKINTSFEEFSAFYGQLVEKGIEETEYSSVFDGIEKDFRELYASSKSNYDALMLNMRQFEEGRLERDAFQRSLTRIERYIISAEGEIDTKILPRFKRAEKELLQKCIVEKVEEINLPVEMKGEIRQEAEKIRATMAEAEKGSSIDQVKEYVGIGRKIIELGQKAWKFAKKAVPVALPFILRIFGATA